MKRVIILGLVLLMLLSSLIPFTASSPGEISSTEPSMTITETTTTDPTEVVLATEPSTEPLTEPPAVETESTEPLLLDEGVNWYSDYRVYATGEETTLVGGYDFDREFLAKMLYREGGAMNWVGQVYTCSAILNFCDVHGRSLWNAGHDPNAFSVAYTVDSAVPTKMNYEVVDYVLSGGRVGEICYFRSGGRYHNFGYPVCEVDGHYFSVGEKRVNE